MKCFFPCRPAFCTVQSASRRFGRSLGINLSPGSCKLCSFNCAYCHYGKTERLVADARQYKRDLPPYPEIIEAVQEALRSRMELDAVTFSGNGEPTLHPDFPALVEGVIYLRNKYRPRLKIALLSNSTGLGREDVRRAVMKLDLPVFKLDAGTEKTFRKINRPAAGVRFEEIVSHLKSLGNVYLQTILDRRGARRIPIPTRSSLTSSSSATSVRGESTSIPRTARPRARASPKLTPSGSRR